jgi:hypothetical protein
MTELPAESAALHPSRRLRRRRSDQQRARRW